MTRQLNVYALPELAHELPATGASVAIDVLRATTTITTALFHGAARVLPFETVAETFAAKERALERGVDANSILLRGERGGLPIENFDLGNSPDLYGEETVKGKSLFFTTTNGTKAILRCRGTVLLACFLNLEAVVRKLLSLESVETISIVCAGTCGQYTEEDLLLAGALTDRLTLSSTEFELNVQAEVSREAWRVGRGRPLVELLRESRGGQNLKRLKLLKDVGDAAQINSLDVVPEYRIGEIRLSGDWQSSSRRG